MFTQKKGEKKIKTKKIHKEKKKKIKKTGKGGVTIQAKRMYSGLDGSSASSDFTLLLTIL